VEKPEISIAMGASAPPPPEKKPRICMAPGIDFTEDGFALAGMRPVPKSIQKTLYEMALRKVPWEKIRDEITVPLMGEVSKGTEALKDSANSYMHRATHPPDKLIDEAVANYLRKFGK
jgi:hypothetical protein